MDGGKGFDAIPLRASSKQWVGSQCDVKITTVWPRDLRPRAASMTRRSAPPMPRSGWMKIIVFFFGGADFLSERGIIVLGEGKGCLDMIDIGFMLEREVREHFCADRILSCGANFYNRY